MQDVQRMTAVERALFAPIPIAPLVYFRIAFGILMLVEVWRYFDNGWIWRYYIQPQIFFTYHGFDWLRPLPGDLMYLHFHLLGLLSFGILIGLTYRVVMPLFFLGFTYVFLLDQTNYLNHFYLISLISFLLIFVPAHRALSVDVLFDPSLRSRTAPAWTLGILLFQIGIVYVFGGIAKLNGDWLRGEPMRMWLADSTDFPLIGHLFTEEWMVYGFTYGGLLLDLFAIPLLLWQRTRWLAVIVLVAFHLINARLFSIGIFPPFMLATLPLFMPLRWWARLNKWIPVHADVTQTALVKPHYQRLVMGGLAVYCAAQILLPLRHFLYPNDVNWTEDGHKFSWHMKLRDKDGWARFTVRDPDSGETWTIVPDDYLTQRQVSKLPGEPDMILQFSHFLADWWRGQGVENVEVYAEVAVSLNGRRYQTFVDPTVNLAAQPRTLLPTTWIVPLEVPLEARRSR